MPTARQNAEALLDQAIGSAMAVPGTVSSHQLAAALRSVRAAFSAFAAGDTPDNPEPVVENPVEEARLAAGFPPKDASVEERKEALDVDTTRAPAPESPTPVPEDKDYDPPLDDTDNLFGYGRQPEDPELLADASAQFPLGRKVGAPEVTEPQTGVPLNPDDPSSNIPPPAQPNVSPSVQPALQVDDVQPLPKAAIDAESPPAAP